MVAAEKTTLYIPREKNECKVETRIESRTVYNDGITYQEKEPRVTFDPDSDDSPSNSPTENFEKQAIEDSANMPPEKNRSRGKIALIMAALGTATFLAALDMTIITTALPTISKTFHSSQADYTWIGSAYMLAAASATPIWGKVSDIFGRKPILLTANIVFLIGSLLCGVSINIKMLIAGRAVQGIGGGGLLALVNISISDLFSMRSRGVYFGIIGVVWAIAGAVGPVVGGIMTQYVTWRWCFYINLPIDATAFCIIFWFLDIHTPKTPLIAGLKAIDWLGSITIVAGTVMFLLGLEYGGVSFPWSSATVVCLLIFGILSLAIFLVIQWKLAYYPIMPLWLFSRRSTVAAFATAFVHGSIYTSGTYFLPLYFQLVLEATPLHSGIYLFPLVLSIAFVSIFTGYFIRKTGLCLPPVWGGMAMLALGQGLFIDLPTHTSWARIVIYQLIEGTGTGPNFQAPLIALQSHLQPSDIATATATLGFIRNMANSISVVLGGVIFQNRMQANIRRLASVLSAETLRTLESMSAIAATDFVKGLPDQEKRPVLNAYNESMKAMWIFYTVLAAIGFVLSLLIGRKKLETEHKITETGLEAQETARRERIQREKEKGDQRKARDLES